MATVRIPDDLNARLKAAAAEAGVSATQFVLDAVRARLDGPPAPEPPRARQRATAARPAGSCRHPVGRRVGGICLACGTALTGTVVRSR